MKDCFDMTNDYYITGIDPAGNGFGVQQFNIGVPIDDLLDGYREKGYTQMSAVPIANQTDEELAALVPHETTQPPATHDDQPAPPTENTPTAEPQQTETSLNWLIIALIAALSAVAVGYAYISGKKGTR